MGGATMAIRGIGDSRRRRVIVIVESVEKEKKKAVHQGKEGKHDLG